MHLSVGSCMSCYCLGCRLGCCCGQLVGFDGDSQSVVFQNAANTVLIFLRFLVWYMRWQACHLCRVLRSVWVSLGVGKEERCQLICTSLLRRSCHCNVESCLFPRVVVCAL